MSSLAINSTVHQSWAERLPSIKTVQRGLLASSAAMSIISLIPSMRFGGALASRSVVLLSAALNCVKTSQTSLLENAKRYAKVGIAALGLAAVAAASPMLLAASLVSDIGVQMIDLIKSVKADSPGKIAAHVSMIVIDALALGAVVVGSWKLMVAAAAVNAVALFGFMVSAMDLDDGSPLEVFSYMSLMFANCISAYEIAPVTKTYNTNSTFSVNNPSGQPIKLYDKHGTLIATAQPGETLSLDVPYKNTSQRTSYEVLPTGNGGMVVVPTKKGSYIQGITFDAQGNMNTTKYHAVHIATQTDVLRPPMPVEQFATVPIGICPGL